MKIFFDMPIEFQIGLIVAVVFLVLALLLMLCKRGVAMQAALLISFLSYLIFFRCPGLDLISHVVATVFVYVLIWLFLVNQFIAALAKEQLKKEWKLYNSDYKSVPIDPREFTWLDLDYYDTKQRELELFGFQKVDDTEFLSQTDAFPETRTFSRTLTNSQRNIEADITQTRIVKPKNIFERSIDNGVISFSSEFSDGTCLETNNTRGIVPIMEINGIVMQAFEPTISIEKLLDIHEKKIEAICNSKKVNVVIHQNAYEVSTAAERKFILFCKDRKEKGGYVEFENNIDLLTNGNEENKDGAKAYLDEYAKQARKRKQKNE
ncbi:MAG: hypothetical protein LBJ00_02575 [Planctomycetaceae bacterium]|jgi:hypothetical protein|nr:hypothetical protein [Planctomycetaceae bacterium]